MERELGAQQLIISVCTDLAAATPERFDVVVEAALRRAAALVAADRSYVVFWAADREHIDCVGAWSGPGVKTSHQLAGEIKRSQVPALMAQLERGKSYEVRDRAELPAGAEREVMAENGVKSVLIMPVMLDGRVVGAVGFDWIHGPGWWDDDATALLRVIGNLVAGAVTRQRTASTLRASEERLHGFMAATEEAMWCFELERPIDPALPVADQFDLMMAARLVDCNDAYSRSHGVQRQELIGRRMADLTRSTPSRLLQLFRTILQHGDAARDAEVELATPAGRRVLSVYVRLLRDNGRVNRVWGSFRDVTERVMRFERPPERVLTQ